MAPAPSGLHCGVCLDFLRGFPTFKTEDDLGHELRKHSRNLMEIDNAVERNCLGCKALQWALEPYRHQIVVQQHEVHFVVARKRSEEYEFTKYIDEGRFLRFRDTSASSSNVIIELELMKMCSGPGGFYDEIDPGSDYSWRELQPAPRLSESMGSPQSLACVKCWLEECLDKHSACLSTSTSQLPTRVLQIDRINAVKLYEAKNEAAPYACLSHCWGKAQMITTTTLSLRKHFDGIPWDDLPLTFQQAIEFSYNLGIRYLWIDSLCIVQDSDEDWQREGGRMAQIYQNALLTLSATRSSGPSGGCFMRSGHFGRTKTFADESGEQYDIQCREKWADDDWAAPLNRRGWVYQERMLSRRVVHFMDREIWWECEQQFACECASKHHKVRTHFGYKSTPGESFRDGKDLEEIESFWETIVTDYTLRLLTFPDDIFPALQGLAKLVPTSMGAYLAGHWENTFARSLCWYVESFNIQSLRSKSTIEWRAPTWSWASAYGQVSWGDDTSPSPHRMEQVTFVSAHIVPRGTERTGQLSAATITLAAPCLRGEISEFKNAERQDNSNLQEKQDMIPNSARERLTIFGKADSWCSREQGGWWCYPHWDYPLEEEKGTEVVIMNIEQAVVESYALILRVVNVEKRIYERVGIMRARPMTENGDHISNGWNNVDTLWWEESEEMELTII